MPGCDSPRCKLSCNGQARSPRYQIDSLKSVRPTTIPLADYRCCGVRHNRGSIAWGKIDTTMEATRHSISAYQRSSLTSPRRKNRQRLRQLVSLPIANSSVEGCQSWIAPMPGPQPCLCGPMPLCYSSKLNKRTPRRMLKKVVQQGRNEGRPEAYPLGYVEGLNDARTQLAAFFSILLDRAIAASARCTLR